MRNSFLLITIPMLVYSLLANAAEMATTIQDSSIYQEPYRDSPVVMEILANSTLLAAERKGGWYRVTVANKSGWIRMTALRFGGPIVSGGDEGAIGAIQLLSTGRSGYSGVTAGTGIRGLSPSDMLNAAPNMAALERLARYRSSPAAAHHFAERGGLSAARVSYLTNSVGRSPPRPATKKSGSFDPFQGLGGN